MFKDLIQNVTKFFGLWEKLPRMTCWTVVYKTVLSDSEQLKTTFAVYNQDVVQKNEPTSYTGLKDMVKRCLDQVSKDRNFDDRNDTTSTAAPIRRKAEDRSKHEEGTQGNCGR